MSNYRSILAGVAVALCASVAQAFLIGFPPPPPSMNVVVEFYNNRTGHYFLTAESDEAENIDQGRAGAGWLRTGHRFFVDNANGLQQCPTCATFPVRRFYAPAPNTHVYSSNPDEVAALRHPGSGWIDEKTAFYVTPTRAGTCGPGLVPIQRFYNGRAAQNDSNHRYAASARVRDQMLASNWIPEEVVFCAYQESEYLFRIPVGFAYHSPPGYPCRGIAGLCLDSVNLAPLTAYSDGFAMLDLARQEITGSPSARIQGVHATAPGSIEHHSFVQHETYSVSAGAHIAGVYLNTLDRGTGTYTSLNPMREARIWRYPGDPGQFFPFVASDTDRELRIHAALNVKRLETFSPGSQAYGSPVLEFVDQGSGVRLLFAVQAFGTLPPSDGHGMEVDTGTVIVATVFRPDALYGRSRGANFLPTASPFLSSVPHGEGGAFDFRISRDEFRKVIATARGVDPRLSDSPDDYQLLRFGLRSEIAGDGHMGYNFHSFLVELVNR